MRWITVPAPLTAYPSPSRAVSFGAPGEYEVEDDVAAAAIAKGATDGAASRPAKVKRVRKAKAAPKAPTKAPVAPAPVVAAPFIPADAEPTE